MMMTMHREAFCKHKYVGYFESNAFGVFFPIEAVISFFRLQLDSFRTYKQTHTRKQVQSLKPREERQGETAKKLLS